MGNLPPHFRERLKRRIANRRGLDLAKKGKLRPVEVPTTPSSNNKSLVMRMVEANFGTTIEVLIDQSQGEEQAIAKRLGVSESTISRWRLRLGMRTTSSSLEEAKYEQWRGTPD